MNFLRVIGLISVFILTVASQVALADETVSEKVEASSNNVKRTLRKGSNRVQEAVCMEGDLKCASKKVKNRSVEAKDSTVDAVKEVKNKID